MDINDIWSLRQSVRRYTEEAVSEKEIDAMIGAAEAAPIGKHNTEGYELAVITDAALLGEMKREYQETYGLGGHPGSPFFGAPLLFIILGNRKTYDFLEQKDAGILAENIHLEATALGLGSVILYNFVKVLGRNPIYKESLGLREDQYPLLGVAVGHPAGALHARTRKHWLGTVRK